MLRLERHQGPRAFLARAEAWLLAREDRNNLILGLAYGRAATHPEGDDEALYATVERDGLVVGCVLRTPPHKLILTDLPPEAGPVVSGALLTVYDWLPSVLAPAGVGEAFAEAWAAANGCLWTSGMEQRIYRLDEVTPPTGVSGSMRLANPGDLDLAVEWGEGFARDTGLAFPTPREAVGRWIEREQLFLWEDGAPGCIAVAHGRTPNGVRIGYVYTPPECRGRGYASALVAGVSQAMLDLDMEFCVLYTDLSNPTSNAIYVRVGYRPIADVRDFDFRVPEDA